MSPHGGQIIAAGTPEMIVEQWERPAPKGKKNPSGPRSHTAEALAPVLAACDASGLPVYLENSNPANSGFYAAHGFERMGIFNIDGDNTPVMEPMWREPKAP